MVCQKEVNTITADCYLQKEVNTITRELCITEGNQHNYWKLLFVRWN